MEPVLPNKRGAAPIVGVFLVIVALLLTLAALAIIDDIAWQGTGSAITGGAVLGLTIGVAFVGVLMAIQRPRSWALIGGVFAGVTALASLAGPPVSLSDKKAAEEAAWNAIVVREKSGEVNPYEWDTYEQKVPLPLRRPERDQRRMVARAIYATKDKDLSALRALLLETSSPADSERYAEARADAKKTLSEAYAKGIAKLRGAPEQVDGSDVPMDPALRKAFAALLDDLAGSPSSLVYVAFEPRFDLTPPEGADAALARARRDLVTSHRYPNDKAPVIELGEAVRHDGARVGTFLSAIGESFKVALEPNLLSFTRLASGKDRKGELVLSIAPTVTKTAAYRPLDSSTEGKDDAKVTGLLVDLEVHWRFSITDRAGTELYKSDDIVTAPADKIHADTGANDPDWAMYSVLLDSAYYGFTRQLTGRFGLPPPAPRESFRYVP